jgi:phage terminase small subunit
MPLLTNPKHEHFAQLVAKGESAQKAYVLVGYSEAGASASATRLLKDARVLARVAELRANLTERMVEKTAYDLTKAMQETDEALRLALAKENPGAAVAAITLRSKLNGLLVDKKEIRTGPLGEKSEAELDDIIRRAAAEAQVSLGAGGEGPETRH